MDTTTDPTAPVHETFVTDTLAAAATDSSPRVPVDPEAERPDTMALACTTSSPAVAVPTTPVTEVLDTPVTVTVPSPEVLAIPVAVTLEEACYRLTA